jgi:hypothetical protein
MGQRVCLYIAGLIQLPYGTGDVALSPSSYHCPVGIVSCPQTVGRTTNRLLKWGSLERGQQAAFFQLKSLECCMLSGGRSAEAGKPKIMNL